MNWKIIFLFPFCLGLAACSTSQVLRDRDYQDSLQSYAKGDTGQALRHFPKKEDGGFLTSTEKGWLRFWDGHSDPTPLQKQDQTFQARSYTSLTREAQTFLFAESEEGYVPSEPEIIILHLVSALNDLDLGKKEDAEVEARAAAYLLQSYQPSDETRFDDPALRVWLAGVWAAIGLWHEAQVDLRRAAAMTKDASLAALAEEQKSPKELNITFDGVAPHFIWQTNSASPSFGDAKDIPPYKAISTYPWLERHLERNTALREALLKSNYMAQFLEVKTGTTSERVFSKAAAITGATIGIITGAAIIVGGLYLASLGGGTNAEGIGYIVAGGAGIMGYSITNTSAWDKENQISIDSQESSSFENMRTYRILRYMPDWISISKKSPVTTFKAKEKTFSYPNSTKVTFTNNF